LAQSSRRNLHPVGIDHGFSFPLRYFEAHGLEPNWSSLLDDFHRQLASQNDWTSSYR
jgi:hypothetical protein